MTPPFPAAVSSNAFEFASIEKMISECSAASLGDWHHTAPRLINPSAFAFVRLKTESG